MLDITFDPRAVGEVVRYHTWSTHHKQSVGEHSWQILRILLTIWPGAPRRMMIHTVKHDMGEMMGDIAYPFKQLVPELKHGSVKAEEHVMREMAKTIGIPRNSGSLSRYEYVVFKLCEHIEMWEYGLHEMNMGNKYGEIIVSRMMAEIGPALHMLDTELTHTPDAVQHPGIPEAAHRYILQRMRMENVNG